MRPAREIDGRYAQYLILNREFINEVDGSTYGSKMPRASWEFVGAMEVTTPLLPEQTQIAAFLDHETAKIDRLIEKQQALISLLKEKRQAVISHAVTKGLDPSAPQKDSGIDWLGRVSATWKITRLGWLCDFISYGFTNPMPTTDDGPFMLTATDIDFQRIKYDEARRTEEAAFDNLLSDKSKPESGDVLLTKDGTLGRVAVFDGHRPTCISQSIALLRLRKSLILPEFLSMALSGSKYQSKMTFDAGGTTIKHIYISILAKMEFVLPELEMQKDIVKALGAKLGEMDALIENADEAAVFLQERRTALISAAVTGKIDVRRWQASSNSQANSNPT